MFSHLGVRGRLFLAFFGISAFAVLAAATAMYSFLEVGNALERIIQFRVPSAIASLQLSRQAERIVAAAPALLTVTTPTEHDRVSGTISAEVDRLDGLLSDLERRGTDPTYVEDGRRRGEQRPCADVRALSPPRSGTEEPRRRFSHGAIQSRERDAE